MKITISVILYSFSSGLERVTLRQASLWAKTIADFLITIVHLMIYMAGRFWVGGVASFASLINHTLTPTLVRPSLPRA
jgi:hypothetical protein